MVSSNYDRLCADLEKQELEAPNGIPSAQVYAQLLAIYLYQNDLCSAKYLWKRIPQSIETANPELFSIWSVGQKMWKRDFAGTYRAIAAHSWNEPIKEIMKALEDKVRDRAIKLISKAYSSISSETMVSMTGLTNEDVINVCNEKNWEIIDGGLTITPKPLAQPSTLHTSSEDQLYKLTEFVSFLEN